MMNTIFDRRMSLQELERSDWGEPENDSSLVSQCHHLRRVPIEDFNIEDLRIMIGQRIGLSFLVPLALERLDENPVAEGDFFPGDLLNAVMDVPAEFWRVHADLHVHLSRIVSKAKGMI